MKNFIFAVLLLFAFFAAACHSEPEKHYPLQGEVISVEPPRATVTLKHGEIPGLMPAMTMNYVAGDPNQLDSLHPGDRISADLVVSDSKGRLEKITLLPKSDDKSAPVAPPAK